MKFGVREILFVGAMLGLLACSYFLVFNKVNARRAAIESDIVKKQRALADLDKATTGVSDMSMKIDELGQAIAFFESKLPQEKEVDKILKEVWQMAEKNNLTTKTIKTMKSHRSSSYSEQPIEMSLSGAFEGYYAFVLQLEQLPRLTRVTKMDLKKMNERDGAMEASLTLSIFFEPDGGGTSSSSAPATASAR